MPECRLEGPTHPSLSVPGISSMEKGDHPHYGNH